MARVEILHTRDPDCECGIQVWVDGESVEADVMDMDPGRGYNTIDIVEMRQDVNAPGRSPAFVMAIEEAFDEMEPTYRRWSLD